MNLKIQVLTQDGSTEIRYRVHESDAQVGDLIIMRSGTYRIAAFEQFVPLWKYEQLQEEFTTTNNRLSDYMWAEDQSRYR